jgi:hypothetical protein
LEKLLLKERVWFPACGDLEEVHLEDGFLHVVDHPLARLKDFGDELTLLVAGDLQALTLARGGEKVAPG